MYNGLSTRNQNSVSMKESTNAWDC